MSSSYPPLPPSPPDVKPNIVASTIAIANPLKKKMKFAAHVVRQDVKVSKARPQVSKEQREKMSEKDLLNLVEKITKGFTPKLSMVDYDKMTSDVDNESIFLVNEGMENFVTSYLNHCVRYDMAEILQEFPLLKSPEPGLTDRNRFDGTSTINLLDNWDKIGDGKAITLHQIATTVAWMKRYTSLDSESYLDDMDWQHRFLMECVDTKLSDSILSSLRNDFEVSQHGGPLTFAIMIDKCINLSSDAIDGLKAKIEELKLTDIAGENVEVACRRILYGLKRLESNQALPHNVLKSLFATFQTSSVPEFNKYVEHWNTSLLFMPKHQHPHYVEVLNKLNERYRALCLSNAWFGIGAVQDSVFNVEQKRKPELVEKENIWCQPTDKDKVSSNPVRYLRIIMGKEMKFCWKCIRRYTTEKGRWNTTHFTDEHVFRPRPRPDDNNDGAPSANVAVQPSTNPSALKVSFKEALSNAAAKVGN